MKRAAVIIIPILFILSAGTTAYLLVKEEEKPQPIVSVKTAPSPKPTAYDLSPSPSASESSAILTPTPTVAGKTQGVSNQIPICQALSASPNSGTAPLTVHFVASAQDLDGSIKKFEFNYGDGKSQTIEKNIGSKGSLEIDHTYTSGGSFTATLKVQDNTNAWSNPVESCQQIITVEDNSSSALSKNSTQIGGPSVLGSAVLATTSAATPTKNPQATATATAILPNIPTAGGFLPTILVGLGGMLIIFLGLVLAV